METVIAVLVIVLMGATLFAAQWFRLRYGLRYRDLTGVDDLERRRNDGEDV